MGRCVHETYTNSMLPIENQLFNVISCKDDDALGGIQKEINRPKTNNIH